MYIVGLPAPSEGPAYQGSGSPEQTIRQIKPFRIVTYLFPAGIQVQPGMIQGGRQAQWIADPDHNQGRVLGCEIVPSRSSGKLP